MVSINWHDFKWHWKWKTNGYDLTDVQKAFDTKDHEILLAKMKCIGFSDKIKCFHSYLTSRAFSISKRIVFLKVRTINCWVSQGSILRPLVVFVIYKWRSLLCLLYRNDILQALSNIDAYLYAGDTSWFYQYKEVAEIENVLNK